MMTTLRIMDLVFTILLFMFMALVVYSGLEEAKWKERCKDVGGIPTSGVCINPGAVIEVD